MVKRHIFGHFNKAEEWTMSQYLSGLSMKMDFIIIRSHQSRLILVARQVLERLDNGTARGQAYILGGKRESKLVPRDLWLKRRFLEPRP